MEDVQDCLIVLLAGICCVRAEYLLLNVRYACVNVEEFESVKLFCFYDRLDMGYLGATLKLFLLNRSCRWILYAGDWRDSKDSSGHRFIWNLLNLCNGTEQLTIFHYYFYIFPVYPDITPTDQPYEWPKFSYKSSTKSKNSQNY